MFAFIPPASAQLQPYYVNVSAIAASTGADVTVTLPSGYMAYDVLLLLGWVRDQDDTVTVNGWTAMTGTPFTRNVVSKYWLFWTRATSSSLPNPVFDKSGSTGDTYVMVVIYRNAATSGDPWEVKGAPTTGTSDPALYPSITSLSDNALMVNAIGGEDNNNVAITTTSTDPAEYVEHYASSATGTDGCVAFSDETRLTAGATGAVSVDWNVGNPVGWGGMMLALKPSVGAAGQDGYNSLVTASTVSESPGANCANGGWKQTVKWGLDNGDGGGVARDGTLQAGEVDGSIVYYSCKGDKGDQGNQGLPGFSALIVRSIASVPECTYGGWHLDGGLDDGIPSGTPWNYILEPGEVDWSVAICNGAPGADGEDGYNALVNLTDADVANCTHGGQRIDAGQDVDGNGYLDAGEIMYTSFACHGAPGNDGAAGPTGPLNEWFLVLFGIALLVLMGLAAFLELTVFMLMAGIAGIVFALIAVPLGLPTPWFLVFLVAGLMTTICSPLGD